MAKAKPRSKKQRASASATQSTLQHAVKPSRRAIEAYFPIEAISELSKMESYRKEQYRPTYYIHKWWARRTGSVFRAMVLGSLLDDSEDIWARYYEPHDLKTHVVLDPFMGGGTTVGESIRLGARAIGVDVSPVAWMLARTALEPTEISALDAAFAQIKERCHAQISRLYQSSCASCNSASEIIYAYWAMVVPCGKCRAEVTLRRDMVVAPHATTKNIALVTCPKCEELFVTADYGKDLLPCPACATAFNPREGNATSSKYRCSCGNQATILSALQTSRRPPNYHLLGHYLYCGTHGKHFRRATTQDCENFRCLEAEAESKPLFVPDSAIPPGYNTDQMRRYNFLRWSDLFNPRQKLALSLLARAIADMPAGSAKDNLAVLLSGALEFNNMFCGPKGLGTGAVRHIFAHHAFIPSKLVLEANAWGLENSSGGFAMMYKRRLRPAKIFAKAPYERKLAGGKASKHRIAGDRLEAERVERPDALLGRAESAFCVLNQSSESLPLPDKSIDAVITDPPFFDSVMYSELSEFFYVWLRLMMKDAAAFTAEHVDHRGEFILNPAQGKDKEFYTQGLASVFTECKRVLKDEGVLAFTFHHGKAQAWNSIAEAISSAGFVVSRYYPVHAEMDVAVPILGKDSSKFDIIFVCRKAGLQKFAADPQVESLREEVKPLINRLGQFGLARGDIYSFYYGALVQRYTQGRLDSYPAALDQHVQAWVDEDLMSLTSTKGGG
jgi:putative DNA methylase